MIKQEALATIITETVQETAKDLSTLLQVIQLVAKVTLEVTALLSNGKPLEFDQSDAQTRGMKDDVLAWKAAVRYQEKVDQNLNI